VNGIKKIHNLFLTKFWIVINVSRKLNFLIEKSSMSIDITSMECLLNYLNKIKDVSTHASNCVLEIKLQTVQNKKE